jgi:RNA polymerase sigma-70 factor, ECF subfamily
MTAEVGRSGRRYLPAANSHDAALVTALRAGDEAAFATLIDRYYATMLRVARMYVATKEAAEDVVSETLLGVIQGIDRFEGRSSLKTWLFRILVNRAKTRGQREARSRPFSSLAGTPSVDPDRFRTDGSWATPPSTVPENEVLAAEAGEHLMAAIDALPPAQRTVITLRDIEGFSGPEVSSLLEISEANQRVLLHRARSKVRAALECYLEEQAA